MQLTGKVFQILPMQTGTGKNGTTWKKQEFIVETEGQFPKKICFSMWGDKINESALKPGNMLKIDFDIESREYNSRWYTDLRAWKVEIAGEATGAPTSEKPPPAGNVYTASGDDDLPF
ncbi:MAG TPA: DUF3127 domain-containing protein [Flavisolibacter sp.]|jgi:hypothetical protein|nr:DUF3127 domain-containing protein [Flavisolibacter sp.]